MSTLADRLRERAATLDTQLREMVARRDQARTALEQFEIAIHQMQGARAVLQELLADPADAAP